VRLGTRTFIVYIDRQRLAVAVVWNGAPRPSPASLSHGEKDERHLMGDVFVMSMPFDPVIVWCYRKYILSLSKGRYRNP
jgi:hypothetical protein